MPITVQTSNIIPKVQRNYFETLSHNGQIICPNSVNLPFSYSAMHQLSTFSTVPSYYAEYSSGKIGGEFSTNWLNQVSATTEKPHQKDKTSFSATKNASRSKDIYRQKSQDKSNRMDTGSTPKIWRPFSPPPVLQEDSNVENSDIKRNSRNANRHVFHSIKPSNVKIGHSKSSVFKVVRKNSYACTQCSSRYFSNRQLNTHMKIHTGAKPFRCEYPNCYKTFARNEELTRHKRIHSGFKPHLCTVCKKRFGRKDHLSKHLKTHLQTSEKKIYQCSFPGCGHRYTRSDALTRHKSTAHAAKDKTQ